ncbi:MAG: ATP phosphoribosyltransferase regulatory subunit [Candidatus Peribacteria bacterium]|nr:MAG: ATP phosphoribosyltransferase regulatory subunit [Candidatus Peribacteria bacterium]
MQKFLKKDSKAHYIKVKEYLDVLGVEYVEDHTLIPEYEYRTHTVWQFRAIDDGEVISWGGRYNKLANRMGIQKEIPAVGFSSKVDTLIKMLRDKDIQIRNKDKIDLYFVQLGDEAKKVVLPLSIAAREAGINTTVSLGTPSMKEQMLKAQRSGANFVVMVGIMEARNGVFQVRDQIS